MKSAFSSPKKKKEEVIERVYEIGHSEIIVSKIMDILLKISYNIIRNKYLKRIENRNSLNYFFKQFDKLINFPLIMENENPTDTIESMINEEINGTHIDNYSSNKLNLTLQPIIKVIEPRQSTVIDFKKFNFGEEKKVKSLKNNLKSRDSKLNDSIPVQIRKKSNLEIKLPKAEFGSKKFEFIPITIPIEDEDGVEEADDFTKNQLKGLRNYFKEKEIDRIRKEKFQTELDERRIQEEKTKNKFIDLKSIILDQDGKILKQNNVNTEKLTQPFSSKVIIKSNEENDEISKNLKDNSFKSKLRNLKMKKILDKPKIIENQEIIYIKNETKIEPLPDVYFQPDKINSHIITNGVRLKVDSKLKDGGKFTDPQGRISEKEYKNLVQDLCPNQRMVPPINTQESQKISEKNEEYLDTIKELHTRPSKIYTILVTDINNESMNEKFSTLQEKYSFRLTTKEKNESESKNIVPLSHRQSTRLITDTVIKEKNFEFDTLESFGNEAIYEKFLLESKLKKINSNNVFKGKNVILPKSHGNLIQEMGNLTKYPRERSFRNILNSNGKSIVKLSNSKKI